MPRFAKRTDANHREIVEAFKSLGCSVADLTGASDSEPGCPDILIAKNGVSCLVEIKTEKGKLRKKQEEFALNWKGMRATIRDTDGVWTLVQAMKLGELGEKIPPNYVQK